MARVKAGGKDFVKGNPGGPGRPALTPDEREARKLTATAFQAIANRYVHMTRNELLRARRLKATTILERIVISILMKAEAWGDTAKLNFLLARLIGPVPEKIEINDKRGFEPLTPEERKRLEQLRTLKARASGSAA